MELTVSEIADLLSTKAKGGNHQALCTGAVIDTRRAKAGELFFALAGTRRDGHVFLPEAARKGCPAAVVQCRKLEELPAEIEQRIALIPVEAPQAALLELASYWRSRCKALVVGVTGSVGKTTTKELVTTVLATKAPTLSSPGNYNNELGLPLSLLQLADHKYAVLEMAMRGRGQISQLCAVARPQIGVVTNVHPVHLELLGSMEAIAEAKAELVRSLPEDGTAILNADDPRTRAMASLTPCPVLTFGATEEADVRATDLREAPFKGIDFQLDVGTLGGTRRQVPVHLPLLGLHNVYNALAAAAVGLACGLSLEQIAAGLARAEAPQMRLRIEEGPAGLRIINDAYNASPPSVRAALAVLRELAPPNRRLAVLGDMLELGELTEPAHIEVGKEAARSMVSRLLAVGQYAGSIVKGAQEGGLLDQNIYCAPNADRAAEIIGTIVKKDDVVLVKASRAVGLEKVVTALQDMSRA